MNSAQPTVVVALQQFCSGDPAPLNLLKHAGIAVRLNDLGRRMQPEDLKGRLAGADAVIAGVETYPAALLKSLPRLKLISRCGVGTDAIDLEACRRLGIEVRTTPEETVTPVAEMTVAMILALARNLPLHITESNSGQWKKRMGHLLSEWTIGIVGLGRIGRAVAHLLSGFGPRIIAVDPLLQPAGCPAYVEISLWGDLLRQADCVSLHVSRRPEEGPLLGPNEFREMKKGACLVNTARGFLIDEHALEESLRTGHIAGAALDVFASEPYQGPLSKHPNCILTPHVSTLTKSSRMAMELKAAQHVVDFFSGVRGQRDPVLFQFEGR
ncbi:MAG: phosphoglycerate dehydrogenase [Candidatus Omnitrophica bacterium]|nr:phosphoglycerate dehydrogenase [Candidatus Omnitrophota bacterium]